MSDGFGVFDSAGHPLKVGTRVKLWDDETNQGVVAGIGDFDVDGDAEGGVRLCYPPVEVRFDNADGTESFGTFIRDNVRYRGDDWPDVECEELDSVEHEYVDHVDSLGGEATVCKHCGSEE